MKSLKQTIAQVNEQSAVTINGEFNVVGKCTKCNFAGPKYSEDQDWEIWAEKADGKPITFTINIQITGKLNDYDLPECNFDIDGRVQPTTDRRSYDSAKCDWDDDDIKPYAQIFGINNLEEKIIDAINSSNLYYDVDKAMGEPGGEVSELFYGFFDKLENEIRSLR